MGNPRNEKEGRQCEKRKIDIAIFRDLAGFLEIVVPLSAPAVFLRSRYINCLIIIIIIIIP